MIKKKTLLTLAAALTVSVAAHADGLRELERFLREVNSGSADFTQVTTAPPNRADANVNANAGEGEAATAARNAKTRTSSGKFEFLRPGRFRFDYTKPFAQTIVADGQTLWLHDP
ncbi:MAG: outer-membrane lipoprotein carrier protein LolA, partial [Burkholderiaceae bacterium]|nr:outer-membrane lipoprotein carrier protein LolA [Burkholderiaceae bacterium]